MSARLRFAAARAFLTAGTGPVGESNVLLIINNLSRQESMKAGGFCFAIVFGKQLFREIFLFVMGFFWHEEVFETAFVKQGVYKP